MADIDTTAALADISEGLGFNADTNQDAGKDTLEGGTASDTLEAASGNDTLEAAGTGADTGGSPPPPAPGPRSPTDAPKSWKPDVAAAFATLPPQVQAEIHRREEDFFKGIEGYKAAAGFGQRLHGAMKDYLPILQQYNIDPAAHVNGLLNSHHTLALGTPDQKVGLMLKLVKDYGVDLPTLLRAADPNNQPFVDPTVQHLTGVVNSLQSRLAQQDQHRTAQIQTELSGQIKSFAENPKNVHFNEVANDMVALINSGVSKTLEDAYEKAVWTNPVTRAKETARAATEKLEADRKAAAARTAAARKAAGANVSSSGKSGSATAPVGTIDDTLATALAAIKAR